MPGREELPSTLKRSPDQAQETWIKAHDSAVAEYGEGDANASKQHLLGLARRLGVPGRSRMTKQELAAAIEKENDRRTAAARDGRRAGGRGA